MPSSRALLVLFVAASLSVCALAVRDTKYYDILGVPADADDRLLKKAYKKAALRWHPDRVKGGEKEKKKAEDKFKEVAGAYEVLSDAEKRKMYDQFGEEGLKAGGGGGGGGPGGPGGGFQFQGDPFEMFNMFFGGGGGPGGGGGGGQRMQFNFGGGGGFPGGGFAGGGGGGFPGGGRGGGGPGSGGDQGGLYEDDLNVIDLGQEDFPQGKADWVWLVEFYANWCGHCKQLAPKWKQVAKSLRGVVKVAAVDCEAHKQLCQAQGVKGYPTIQALAPGSSKWQEYKGERSAAALAAWAKGLIPNKVATLKSRADLDALLKRCGGGAGAKKSGDGASYGLCVVLASDKASPPALLQALASAYAGRVAVGFVAAAAPSGGKRASGGVADVVSALAAAAGKEKELAPPVLVSVCNGDLGTAEVYSGQLKSDALQRHLRSYAGGKKCSSQVRLEPGADLSKLSVSQLKALLAQRGVACTGCAEKGEFVAALAAAVEAEQQGGQEQHHKPHEEL